MSTSISYAKAGMLNFLGSCPVWYKNVIIACLIINPIVAQYSMFVAGWLLVAEFIFTLSMALDCYPLEAGGLLVIEACFLGMCDMHHVTKEIESNLEVIMLLMFMVAGIHFVRDFLLFFFTKLLVKVRSNVKLAFLFCFMGYFNGCGNTTFVMAQGIIGAFCVRIPIVYFVSRTDGVTLFRIGLATPASTLIQIVLCILVFVIYSAKNKKKMSVGI